jgi:hypothetical protein
MEVIHDRNNQEFKIELDKSTPDKGFSHIFFNNNKIIFLNFSIFNI